MDCRAPPAEPMQAGCLRGSGGGDRAPRDGFLKAREFSDSGTSNRVTSAEEMNI
jgi:hypothetical protein